MLKKQKKTGKGEITTESEAQEDIDGMKAKMKGQGRSLWEGEEDEKGRTRVWKSKVTGEKIRNKKGEKPHESKGAILADDVSTLTRTTKTEILMLFRWDWAKRSLLSLS